MIPFPTGNPSSQTDKTIQFNEKMLVLAQDLFLEEMASNTLVACGHSFTYRLVGRFGRYETFNGEVVGFEPQVSVNFTLICDEFVVTHSLAMIKMISSHLDTYDLAIAR